MRTNQFLQHKQFRFKANLASPTTGTVSGIDKTWLVWNVDNTSDANKPSQQHKSV
jgi:hypothetical protein